LLATQRRVRGAVRNERWRRSLLRSLKRTTLLATAFSLTSALLGAAAQSQKPYDAASTSGEIKIGNFMPYTGWAKEYGAGGIAEAAYFQMVNDRGGVNGRKIKFITLDTGSEPGKAPELARQLVDGDGVLLLFATFGTENNLAIRAYLNEKKIPQLFVDSSSAVFDDPTHFPWTMGFFATYRSEGQAYAKYILQNQPAAKIAILYADTDAGKEYLAGVREALADEASSMIVKEVSYAISDTALEPQIAALKNSGANVFLNLSLGTFATRAIRAAYDSGWRPLQFVPNASLSVAAFLDPAGLPKAAGIISNARSKSWLHPQSRNDPAVREFLEWMARYNPQASLRDQNNVAGYERAQALVEVLTRCGDDLTRANVMKQAAHLDLELGMLRPGIRITTSPSDYQPVKQLFLIRFNGENWLPLGSVISD
jgi:branched-chain amino acid transport system substrate-binding protein